MLTCVGLYGLLSYEVARRTREIGHPRGTGRATARCLEHGRQARILASFHRSLGWDSDRVRHDTIPAKPSLWSPSHGSDHLSYRVRNARGCRTPGVLHTCATCNPRGSDGSAAVRVSSLVCLILRNSKTEKNHKNAEVRNTAVTRKDRKARPPTSKRETRLALSQRTTGGK